MSTKIQNKKNKEQLFLEKLYDDCYEDIKRFETARNKTKDEIYRLIGYSILVNGTKIKNRKIRKEIVNEVLDNLEKDNKAVLLFLSGKLMDNMNTLCDFYGYKLSEKEKQEIIDKAFVGLTYKDRKKQHDEVRKGKIYKTLIALIIGKITLDKVSHNKKSFKAIVDKYFKSYVKNIEGILITETSRIRNEVFLMMNKGKKVQYCSVLEKNTCADCRDMDGIVMLADECYDIIPQHSRCKCYFQRVED
ncbi:MAG: hypothetical protein ACRDD7_08810 [Peptostreptococcaceae bacterium]